MKGKTKIVMFGKKESVRCDEVEAISRLENTKTIEFLDGVLFGTVMCPFLEEKISQEIEILGITGMV